MEYVDGHRPVPAGASRPARCRSPTPCDYVRQAALGLQHAYEQGLVHRDIKPANLMVTPSPAGPPRRGRPARLPRVKILDMGLARVVDPDGRRAEAGDLTRAGVFLGTPDYVAPEQAEDSRQADIRADIYSLGGDALLPAHRRGAVPRHDAGAEAPPAADRAAAVGRPRRGRTSPPALDALVRRMMARNPAERYPDAGRADRRPRPRPAAAATPSGRVAARRTAPHVAGPGPGRSSAARVPLAGSQCGPTTAASTRSPWRRRARLL